jgi:hypothetical protein
MPVIATLVITFMYVDCEIRSKALFSTFMAVLVRIATVQRKVIELLQLKQRAGADLRIFG